MSDTDEGRELVTVESGTLALLQGAEIDRQIATAKKYPRSIQRFVTEATQMVTLNESIAQQCIYALVRRDRDGQNQTIAGPSARFGEIVASAWGNCRAGARVVNEGAEFVTAQGAFHDLERNVAITYEVQRRIVGSNGRRFGVDMIGVTGNAASSIALRNAILKGVPKAFWEPMYLKARAVIAGNVTTLAAKRKEAVTQFAHFGITEAQILAKLQRPGVADISIDDLVTLFGLLTALRDGDTTPEQAFSDEDAPKTAAGGNIPPEPPRRTEAAAAAPTPAPTPTPAPSPTPTPGPTAAPTTAPTPAPTAAPTDDFVGQMEAEEKRAAGAPLAPPPPAAAAGTLASPGQKQNLRLRAKEASQDLGALLVKIGAAHVHVETLEGLTDEQWKLAKAELGPR